MISVDILSAQQSVCCGRSVWERCTTFVLLLICACPCLRAEPAVRQFGPPADATDGRPGQSVFELWDRDHSGGLSVEEFLRGSVGQAAVRKREAFGRFDANANGSLEPEEFRQWRTRARRRSDESIRRAFVRRDIDDDGKLSLEEFLQGRHGEDHRWARRNFIRFDADADDRLTLEEWLRRGEGVELTVEQQFRLRDEDGDGRLTEAEFLRPVPEKHRRGAAVTFRAADGDGDGTLSLAEFRGRPGTRGTTSAEFDDLDIDGDGRVTLAEFTRGLPPAERDRRWRTFGRFDTDLDGGLDRGEFARRTRTLQTDRRLASWKRAFVRISWFAAAPMAAVVAWLLLNELAAVHGHLAAGLAQWRHARRAAAMRSRTRRPCREAGCGASVSGGPRGSVAAMISSVLRMVRMRGSGGGTEASRTPYADDATVADSGSQGVVRKRLGGE
ncbi:MAG: hypothetical protein D6725_10470 [Planctomycetota bacterium]|nr:MAG: hypothetical protein D6725_10470 [Planctomycetota bacterium]